MLELLNNEPWLLAIAIFAARVGDVSLGTVRTIVVFRGYKFLAAAIGFFEILLWVAAAGQVLTNLDNPGALLRRGFRDRHVRGH